MYLVQKVHLENREMDEKESPVMNQEHKKHKAPGWFTFSVTECCLIILLSPSLLSLTTSLFCHPLLHRNKLFNSRQEVLGTQDQTAVLC